MFHQQVDLETAQSGSEAPNAIIELPAEISIADARLPQTYEQAKLALLQCACIDECQNWANKAEALAAYARMANDDSLRRLSDRIQARAVRRAGELLKLFDGRGRRSENSNGAVVISQAQAAAHAGMSQRQKETAVRVANVPGEIFETVVESEDPPSVTKLAEMGRRARSTPRRLSQAAQILGAVKRFAKFCTDNAPQGMSCGFKSHEVSRAKQHVASIEVWLDRFAVELREQALRCDEPPTTVIDGEPAVTIRDGSLDKQPMIAIEQPSESFVDGVTVSVPRSEVP